MSKYTTELRHIVESGYDLGLKDYPLYTFTRINQGIDYRTYLNNKIIEHFKFREIGFETVALFKYFLNRKMNEIMPYYNQLYNSCDIEFNPLWNVDLTETFTHDVTDNGTMTNNLTKTANETVANEDINVHSDTPQSSITDTDIQANKYATDTDHIKNNGTTDNTLKDTGTVSNINNHTETYTKHEEGSSAGYLFTQNVEQWRKIMLNIDIQIIDELEELFIQLW